MTTIEYQYKLVNLQEGLMRFAIQLTADKDDAKDLLQETFLKALKYCDKFIHGSNIKAWTYTIMKNTFINDYRYAMRYKTFDNQPKEGFPVNYAKASGADDPHSIYLSIEIRKTIEVLDDNLKLPLKMHHEGFKYKEIAEKLQLNLGTVKSRIFIARQKLMKVLDG